MPPVWFDPASRLAQVFDMLFWGALGLIALIVLGAWVVPALGRWGRALVKLFGWQR